MADDLHSWCFSILDLGYWLSVMLHTPGLFLCLSHLGCAIHDLYAVGGAIARDC